MENLLCEGIGEEDVVVAGSSANEVLSDARHRPFTTEYAGCTLRNA